MALKQMNLPPFSLKSLSFSEQGISLNALGQFDGGEPKKKSFVSHFYSHCLTRFHKAVLHTPGKQARNTAMSCLQPLAANINAVSCCTDNTVSVSCSAHRASLCALLSPSCLSSQHPIFWNEMTSLSLSCLLCSTTAKEGRESYIPADGTFQAM